MSLSVKVEDSALSPLLPSPLYIAQEYRVKRMMPLLGTFVRIELYSVFYSEGELHDWISILFLKIKEIEKLMSYYDAESDVSRFNQLACGEVTWVSPETMQVLQFSQSLGALSQNLFNIGFSENSHEQALAPYFKILNFDQPNQSQFLIKKIRSGKMDLGGVAKGFAVDAAFSKIKTLYEQGKIFGSINAGGDLFVFESKEVPIAIKISTQRGFLHRKIMLKKGSLATSCMNVSTDWRLSYRHGKSLFLKNRTISVLAESAMIADGLTKVLMLADSDSEKVRAKRCLHEWGAKGFYEV